MKRGPALLEMTVAGRPEPAGSKTADPIMRRDGDGTVRPVLDGRGRPVFRQRHANPKTKPWMNRVAEQAAAMWGGRALLDGAVWVEILSLEPRPKSHYRTGRYSHLLHPDAPAYPHRTSTGDSDKLRRAVQDALTGVVYRDDKLVVDGGDRKDYWTSACCIIHVGLMEAQTCFDLGIAAALDAVPEGQETLAIAA
jgi:Holliday junction resolvase RusA-like endonuclease